MSSSALTTLNVFWRVCPRKVSYNILNIQYHNSITYVTLFTLFTYSIIVRVLSFLLDVLFV